MVDRTQLLVFIVLAKALIVSKPFDFRGAFVLLQSMDECFTPPLSGIYGTAMHANMTAALSGNRQASEDARRALAEVVADLERSHATLPPAS